MKFVTNDGRFEAEIQGGQAKVKFHLQDFEGEFQVSQMPPKLDELRKTLAGIAEKVELLAGLLKRDLGGD